MCIRDRPWTNTFDVYGPHGWTGVDAGPLRYAAASALRSLVEDLAVGLEVAQGREVLAVGPGPIVDREAADAVVLAMPDPQALDILATTQAAEVDACADREWRPALTLYAAGRVGAGRTSTAPSSMATRCWISLPITVRGAVTEPPCWLRTPPGRSRPHGWMTRRRRCLTCLRPSCPYFSSSGSRPGLGSRAGRWPVR